MKQEEGPEPSLVEEEGGSSLNRKQKAQKLKQTTSAESTVATVMYQRRTPRSQNQIPDPSQRIRSHQQQDNGVLNDTSERRRRVKRTKSDEGTDSLLGISSMEYHESSYTRQSPMASGGGNRTCSSTDNGFYDKDCTRKLFFSEKDNNNWNYHHNNNRSSRSNDEAERTSRLFCIEDPNKSNNTTIPATCQKRLRLLYMIIAALILISTMGIGIGTTKYYALQKEWSEKLTFAQQQDAQYMNQRVRELRAKLDSSKHDHAVLKSLQDQLDQAIKEKEKLAEAQAQKQQKQPNEEQQQQKPPKKLRGGGGPSSEATATEIIKSQNIVDPKDIKQKSHELLLQKYGEGPHFVEIKVRDFVYSHYKNGRESITTEIQGTIVIELASSDIMPHATLWFLEQISNGLYDGCSFYRNTGFVLQAGPIFNDGLDMLAHREASMPALNKEQLDARFSEKGYHSLLSQEYSDSNPHLQYTG